MSMSGDHQQNQTSWFNHDCAVCGSKAIGINFGVPTCAPCKAFFRRNARRKEVLESPCQHRDIIISKWNHVDTHDKGFRELQIRRCSSCRLQRCFHMGMKEELVRTKEENIRHKQLVALNKRRREIFRQKQQDKQLSIPQYIVTNDELLRETDWRHLSNIISMYDTYCLKIYVQQRKTRFNNETIPYQHGYMPIKDYTLLPMSLTASLFSFIQSLPAFHSLSQENRTYLCKNNLRSLLFPNMFELNQSCFSEPWQRDRDKATWELMCGPELFEQFVHTENLAEKSLIADPIITRLWLVVLFFSSSLFCLYDNYLSLKIPKKKSSITEIQNAYAALLWNYLLHRHGYLCAVRIFSNLIHVYLKMQRVGFGIGIQVRTRNDLIGTHETLNQLVTLNINKAYK